ncbi:hypothetical protein ACUZZL_004370, partial [Escherichia coli]
MSTGLRFTLEVDGLPPDAFAVVSFHLNQSLSSLFSLDLSLVSQQFLSLEFAQVLDKMAYLTISETSRSGETVRYRYDDAHSELPATTTDATGSTRQMTWSRYGQLLAFTDCSGYQTRYEYDRFGQMTAVHREEGISLYRHYDNRGRLTSVKDAQGRETRYEY